MKFSLLSLSVLLSAVFSLPASARNSSERVSMDLDQLKTAAFARCQNAFSPPAIAPVPELDPPRNGEAGATGMVYAEELAVRTTNLLDRNDFYFSPRPRAAVNSIPMDLFVDNDGSGTYQRMTWDEANPDYSSPQIQPAIDKGAIPAAGRVLTELIVGHRSPRGDYPQLFDIRSSAYLRFAGFPPQVTGASLRLGAHGIFGHGRGDASQKEDFPVIRALYASAPDARKAHALVLLESGLFCGALSLDLAPARNNALITVDSYWYTREDFHWQDDPNTGLVAYSSMFWRAASAANPHGAAHDSDTLFVKFADGSQTKAAINPPQAGLQTQDLENGKAPVEWMLANLDRNPSHYANFKPALGNTNYDQRASYKVKILSSSIKTGVSLYQMAADGEYGDNLVAVSTIRQDIPKAKSADQFVHFKYSTTAFFPAPPKAGPDQCGFIRDAIQALPDSGGVVQIPAGTFNCSAMIVLKKSHVKIRGAGQDQTTLRLADQSPAPVLVLGDDHIIQDANGNWVTETRLSDVEVSDLTIDGNVANQDVSKECGNGSCDGNVSAIRNNAITIRGASNITLNRVTAHDSISGGLVTEKYCDHLQVNDFTSYGNHFDGFAGYQTQQSLFQRMNLSRNHGAGISIDIDFNNNHFLGGTIAGNGDVGIFARNIHGVVFEKLLISHSGNHGAFLAQSEAPNSCANDNEFRSVTVEGSKGYGIFIADACTGNQVTGDSVFSGNTSGCYFVNSSTKMNVAPSVRCAP
ncbi:MAG: glucan biosynthesis protein [Bdellovibrionota bacterium]